MNFLHIVIDNWNKNENIEIELWSSDMWQICYNLTTKFFVFEVWGFSCLSLDVLSWNLHLFRMWFASKHGYDWFRKFPSRRISNVIICLFGDVLVDIA